MNWVCAAPNIVCAVRNSLLTETFYIDLHTHYTKAHQKNKRPVLDRKNLQYFLICCSFLFYPVLYMEIGNPLKMSLIVSDDPKPVNHC